MRNLLSILATLGIIGVSGMTPSLLTLSPALSQTARNRRVDLTQDRYQGIEINMKSKPSQNVVLKIEFEGADLGDEGEVWVNDWKVAQLFGAAAREGRKQGKLTLKIITSKDYWHEGPNQIEFRRIRDGFTANVVNTWQESRAQGTYPTQGPAYDTQTVASIASKYQSRKATQGKTPQNDQQPIQRSTNDDETRVQNLIESVSAASSPENSGRFTIQLLMAATSQRHFRPNPHAKSSAHHAKYPTPSDFVNSHRLDQPLTQSARRGHDYINGWNHIDSYRQSNGRVEMGPLTVAYYQNGRWTEKNIGAPCQGYVYKQGAVDEHETDSTVIRCNGGTAVAGQGFNGWPSGLVRGLHGWSPRGRINTNVSSIQYYMVWGSARVDTPAANGHYAYSVGGDSFVRTKGKRRNGISHGPHIPLTSNWQISVAHMMKASTVQRLCREGKLPPTIQQQLNGRCR